jgi:hypothetical protein
LEIVQRKHHLQTIFCRARHRADVLFAMLRDDHLLPTTHAAHVTRAPREPILP